ncbi:16S rRNA (guanine(966)-N(2))-methyltransferase RsmD [Frankia sp. CNm7]|uniref:16S rRNA (Guanine(966)-N(2))-methyltransferase RsmD n=1 Tax=Frankia nepalensis TaxID=1836974 RepID=A0A937RV43_9ACTN|nr:16S rRNA (guanine(966)-N(2))-methyltransferase RsmD [Frankia nepalensis]MBL7497011.1 16S rRNA (guanine(966)-N(2))-methyltransferase RsmD [Frankia nepalensis]MBL7510521.1 16S rRNA (guanine(966)-N(2))-methyltransferase RsmD [Frankia nepalensis]MBL7520982.1 16S rRNA (guanine(966)-N(2))-methyltransferase RsmD [Frankia nepalensis]MBL7632441.1 16S rRNA (guanine(966)-N(2))-methyltransferase RsmD [Frankia nepalensis]
MTRIVGGVAGGRRLAVPPGQGTRPTSDRAREGLFNSLATLVDLSGARVADLYAGSGAVGLEALSRGAAHALLVERDPAAARVARRNAAELGLPGAEVVVGAVERVVVATPGQPYDVVFLDPPYALDDDRLGEVLGLLVDRCWLDKDGVCVVERARRSAPPGWPEGLVGVRSRGYGEAVLWYGSRS